MSHPGGQKTWIEISASALMHNVHVLKKHVDPANVFAVVKSNAYGHGLELVASVLKKEVSYFAVDSIEEAERIRSVDKKNPVLIMGYIPTDRLKDIPLLGNISFVAYSEETIKAIEAIKNAKPKTFRIHVKIETGTTRQGIEGAELIRFLKKAKQISSIDIEGVYTHYADIEDAEHATYAKKQLARFQEALHIFDQLNLNTKIVHTAASAAALCYPEMHFTAVRFGISLYGHWPDKRILKKCISVNPQLSLLPVLTWKTVVAQVKKVKKGTSISYGRTEKMKKDGKIAVLPVGYWDGLPRSLSSKGIVLINGKRCKILGRICMNMCMVDVSDIKNVHAGDEVTLIGGQKNGISAEEQAELAQTIQYELLTRINPTIPRILAT